PPGPRARRGPGPDAGVLRPPPGEGLPRPRGPRQGPVPLVPPRLLQALPRQRVRPVPGPEAGRGTRDTVARFPGRRGALPAGTGRRADAGTRLRAPVGSDAARPGARPAEGRVR